DARGQQFLRRTQERTVVGALPQAAGDPEKPHFSSGLLDGRDRGRDLDGRRAPLERAARVDEQPLVARLAAAETADTAGKLDLERGLLDAQLAADAEGVL